MLNRIDMVLIIVQYLVLFVYSFALFVTPITNGMATKYGKKSSYVVALIVNFLLLLLGLNLPSWLYTNCTIIVGYIITIVTVLMALYIILNLEPNEKQIPNPTKLKDYIHNARCEIIEGKFKQFLLFSKPLIYIGYIIIMILNQIGSLGENIFSNSYYLKLNEYSLIILFAVHETAKLLREWQTHKKSK